MAIFLNRGWGPVLPRCGGTGGGSARGNFSRAPPVPPLSEGGRATGRAGGRAPPAVQWDWGSENEGMKKIFALYYITMMRYEL